MKATDGLQYEVKDCGLVLNHWELNRKGSNVNYVIL